MPNVGPPERLVSIAVAAEASGWDAVFFWDHIHLIRALRFEIHDPWVMLGAVAQATERVRLGAMVAALPRRRPQKFAKEVVTLDHLSKGRVIVGVGLGAPGEDEYTMFGEAGDDRARAARLDEALDVVTALWSGEPVTHDGAHFHIDAELRPPPVQRPRPPIWVAATVGSRGPMERAARYEGVVPIGANEEPQVTTDQLRAIADAMPPGHVVTAPWWPGPSVAEYEDAGATWLIESRWPDGNWLDELEESARRDPRSDA
jgi:alkanesulfonate monooxygenase SsuD/methylene tetrahydromethanopterin reductase-like flavin-dependent oxidoreductase (luciferase family)